MGVTLNEIAKAAGVSRGTVDRALDFAPPEVRCNSAIY